METRTDRVAAAAGAAVHVDFLPGDGELGHDGHGHHGEGLVDLEQVHLRRWVIHSTARNKNVCTKRKLEMSRANSKARHKLFHYPTSDIAHT
jgi:hypothetical protein